MATEKFIFLKGRIEAADFQKKYPDKKTVFIFPGNAGHHTDGTTLFSNKSGGGLGVPAGQLSEAGFPVLSLPTTDMEDYETNEKTQKIVEKAVGDLWRAVGAGYNLALPVRKKTDKDKNNVEYGDRFFDMALTDDLEPSFWGENLKIPNKALAKYYIDQLHILRDFLNKKIDAIDAKVPDKFLQAYNQGLANKDKPQGFFAPSKIESKPKIMSAPQSNLGFDKKNKENIIAYFVGNGYQVNNQDNSKLMTVTDGKKNIFTISPNEITLCHDTGNEDDYIKMIEAAIRLKPHQKQFTIYSPNNAEKEKIQKVMGKFKDNTFTVTTDIKEYEKKMESKPEKADAETKHKAEEKQMNNNAAKFFGVAANDILVDEGRKPWGEAEDRFGWYTLDGINSIIKASVTGNPAVICYESHNDIFRVEPKEIKLNNHIKKIHIEINPIPEYLSFDQKISAALDKLIKANPDRNDLTFVFHSLVGGNHFATYACNTQGEIVVIDSLGYKQSENAATTAMTQALENNGIKAQLPIVITPDKSSNFQQRESVCGAITAAMCCAISPDNSFADQQANLENQMKHICEADYNELRREQLKLYRCELNQERVSEDDHRTLMDKTVTRKIKILRATPEAQKQAEKEVATLLPEFKYHKNYDNVHKLSHGMKKK